MKRIYIDQKDYSSIARGLIGQESYSHYVDIYEHLTRLVDSDRIKIFFSFSHLVESLKYYDLTSDLWKIHCEVIDNLSRGNCIIFPTKITTIEIELFLSKAFNFKSQFSSHDYSYGIYKDALLINADHKKDPFGNVVELVKEQLLEKGINRTQRRIFLKQFKNQNRKENFSNMTDQEFTSLADNIKSDPKTNLASLDMLSFLNKERFIKFFTGTSSYKKKLFNEFIDHVFNFRSLVNLYSQFFPDLKNITIKNSFHLKFKKIVQLSEKIDNFSFDSEQTKSFLTDSFLEYIIPTVTNLAKKKKFSKKEAMDLLRQSDLKPIKSIYSPIIFMTEYSKPHLGKSERKRKGLESDTIDLFNLINVPYIDIYLTDTFFATFSKQKALSEFDTIVLKNLTELVNHL